MFRRRPRVGLDECASALELTFAGVIGWLLVPEAAKGAAKHSLRRRSGYLRLDLEREHSGDGASRNVGGISSWGALLPSLLVDCGLTAFESGRKKADVCSGAGQGPQTHASGGK
jgi:hypothetical protein